MKMILIPAGEFMMGSPETEPERYNNESLHKVILGKGFYMQTTAVTQSQWKAVMGDNPSCFSDCVRCPVESISWNDAQEFIKKLNLIEKTDIYRLPTEAEWEYACRAGTDTAYCFGDNPQELEEYGWYEKNSYGTNPVAQKKPNAWGLYDMHGNVWEWCYDCYCDYCSGNVADGSYRVIRGGAWNRAARDCRSAYRGYRLYNDSYYSLGLGLRLLMSLK
jgi:formylglycine-generating enzyme required for sulfatase activity